MSPLTYILLFTFLGSAGSLIGGVFLLLKSELSRKLSHFLTAFAAGVLLATAFLDLLPEAIREGTLGTDIVLAWTLAGLLLFFLTEQLIHLFHRHEESYHEEEGRG
ncbi:MAG: ZIP family metal transporter, partial [Candidatus Pacearchaeota archaeon]|nr:ZIP family metal transporter [Candidatus Pacearchaeota archaeon]